MKKWVIRTGTLLTMVMLCALLPLSFAHAAAPYTLTGVSLSETGVGYDGFTGERPVYGSSISLSWKDGNAPDAGCYDILTSVLYEDEALSQTLLAMPGYEDYYFSCTIRNSSDSDHSIDFTELTKANCMVSIAGYDAECVSVTPGSNSGKDQVTILYKIRQIDSVIDIERTTG